MAKATHKQYTTKGCFVCGETNPNGLKMTFYETEDKEVVGLFEANKSYCSYPDILHGGISATILDETIGRAIMIDDPKILGMTLELNLKYKRPVKGSGTIRAVGRITRRMGSFFEGTGEIVGDDGKPCVLAKGIYIIMDSEKREKLGDNTEFIYHKLDKTQV